MGGERSADLNANFFCIPGCKQLTPYAINFIRNCPNPCAIKTSEVNTKDWFCKSRKDYSLAKTIAIN